MSISVCLFVAFTLNLVLYSKINAECSYTMKLISLLMSACTFQKILKFNTRICYKVSLILIFTTQVTKPQNVIHKLSTNYIVLSALRNSRTLCDSTRHFVRRWIPSLPSTVAIKGRLPFKRLTPPTQWLGLGFPTTVVGSKRSKLD